MPDEIIPVLHKLITPVGALAMYLVVGVSLSFAPLSSIEAAEAPATTQTAAVDRLMAQARSLLDEGKLDQAIAILRRPVFRQDARAYYWLGVAWKKKGRLKDAITALRQAIRLIPGLVDAHTLLGDIYQSQGRLDLAIEQFEFAGRLVVNTPFQATIRDILIGLYKVRADRFIKELPSHSELAMPAVNLGKKMFRLELYSSAARLLETVVENDRENAQAYYWLGQIYLRRRQQNEGLRSLERSVALAPDNQVLRMQLGKAYEDLGRFDKAEAIYRRILGTPGLAADIRRETQRRLGVIEARRNAIAGETEQALAGYQRLLKETPDDIGLLELASLALEKLGRRKEADVIYERLMRLLPDDANLRLRLAETYRLRGDILAMQAMYKEALALARDEEIKRQAIDGLGMKKGDEFILQGEYEQARKIFEYLQTIVPDSPEILMRLARIAIDQARFKEAEGYLEKVLAIDNKRLDAQLNLGRLYMRTGRSQQAIDTLEKVASAGAAHEEARAAVPLLKKLYSQEVARLSHHIDTAKIVDKRLQKRAVDFARRLYGRGLLKDAETVFRALLARLQGPEKAQPLYWLGQIELRTGRQDQGLADLQKSVSLSPDNPLLGMALAKAYESAGHWAEAEQAYAAVLAVKPKPPIATMAAKRKAVVKGQRLAKEGKNDEALVVYDTLLKEYPDDLQVLALKGWVLHQLDRQDEADALFAKLLERAPRNIPVRLRLARLYGQQKRYDKAEQIYNQLVRLKPKEGGLHFELARTLLELEHYEDAYREFSQAAALAPPAGKLLAQAKASQAVVIKRMIEKGRKYLDAGQHDEAEAMFQAVLDIDPDEARAHYWLSQSFKQRKAFTEEVKALERSLALSPNNSLLIPILGQAYLDAGLPAKAVDLLKPFVEKDPFAFDGRLLLATAYRKRGEIALAEAQLEWLLRHKTSTEIHKQALAELGLDKGKKALEAGDFALAREQFQRLLEVVPDDALVNRQMAETFIREHAPEKALGYLKKALVQMPDDLELHFELASIYTQLGKRAEAEAEYKLILSMEIGPNDKRRAQSGLDRVLAQRVGEQLEEIDIDSDEMVRSLVAEADEMIELEALTGPEQLANTLIKGRPDRSWGYELLAKVNRQRKKYDDAVILFKKALAVEPRNTRLLRELAQSYELADKPALALAAYRQILAVDPADVVALMAMARIYRDEGDKEAMNEAYLRVLRQSHDDKVRQEVLKGLGMDELDDALGKGAIEQAEASLRRLLSLAPDEPVVLIRQARLYQARGRLEEAVGIYRKLLRQTPGRLDLLLQLGEIEIAMGHAQQAMTVLEKVAQAGPGHAEARRAVSHLKRLYHEAAMAMKKRLQEQPGMLDMDLVKEEAISLVMRLIGRGSNKDGEEIISTLFDKFDPTPEMYYWRGQIELKTQRLDQGLADLARSAELAADNLLLRMELGKALESAGHWAKAEQAYANVVEHGKDKTLRREAAKRRAIVHGQLLASMGRRKQALAVYDGLLKKYPNDSQVLGLRGWLLLELGREDEADAMFARLLKLAPNNARVRLRLASLYKQQGRQDEAEQQLLAILERHREGRLAIQALKMLGLDRATEFEKKQDWQGLEAFYKQMLEKVPDNPMLLKLLAEVYHKQNRLLDFEDTMEQVLRIEPDDADSLWALANVYLTTKRNELAIPLLERLAEMEQKSERGQRAIKIVSDFYRSEVGRLRDQKQYTSAARVLEKFIRNNPDNILARLQLGLFYYFGKNTDKAIEVLEEASRMAPDNAQIHRQLALIYSASRMERKAVESFAHYIALQQDEQEAQKAVENLLLSLVRALLKENRQVAAIRVLERMRDLGLRNKLIYSMLAFVQTRQGQREQAIETYRQGIVIDPNDLLMRYNLGQLYEQTSADMAALAQYRAILKRGKPGNRYVESARQRKYAVEQRLRRFNSSLSYQITGGRSVIEEQDLSNTGAVNTSFSSSLNYRLSTSFHPTKKASISLSGGMAHSLNHSGQNDSIAPSLNINGNLNLGSGFLTASLGYRETYALMLDVFAGYGINASLGGGVRFAHPWDVIVDLFSPDEDLMPTVISYIERPLAHPLQDGLGDMESPPVEIDEKRLRQALSEKGLNVEDSMAAVYRARIALRDGASDAALRELIGLAKALPKDPDINLLLGQIYQELGDNDAALDSYWQVFDGVHDSPLARYYYGEVLMTQGYFDEAAEWFAAVLRSSLSTTQLKTQARKRLTTIYRKRLARLLAQAPARERRVEVLEAMNRLADLDVPLALREEAERVLSVYPDAPRVHLMLGRAWLRLGRPDKALPELERARDALGDSMEIDQPLVETYLGLGRLPAAIERYRWQLAQTADPERRFGLRLRIPVLADPTQLTLASEQETARARQQIEDQWPQDTEDPTGPDRMLALTDAVLQAGHAELALEYYRRIDKHGPGEALLELRMVEALMALHRDEEANDHIRQALENDGSTIVHYRALALLGFYDALAALDSGHYEEAVDRLDGIHDVLEDDPLVLLNMALAKRHLDKDIETKSLLETSIENEPRNLTAHWLLGLFYSQQNRLNRGMNELERVVADGPGTLAAEESERELQRLEQRKLSALIGEEINESEATTKTFRSTLSYSDFTPVNHSLAETKSYGINNSLSLPSTRWGNISLGFGVTKVLNENPLGTDYANTTQSYSLSYSRPIPGVPRLRGGLSLSQQVANYDNFDSNARVKLGRLAKRQLVRRSLSVFVNYSLHKNLTLSGGYSQSRARANLPVGLVYRPDDRPIAFQSLGLGDVSSKSLNVSLSFRF